MTPLFGFYDDLERYSSTVNSNFVLNIPYTLLREIFIKWETEQKKYILPKEENKMSFGELSAVEWLIEQIFNSDWKNMCGEDKLKIFEQAKEMEKQQIIDAFDEGQEYEYQYHINNAPKFDSETYFAETYGSKGSDEHIVDTNEMVCYTKQDVIDAIIKIHEIYSLHGQYNDTLEAKKLRLKGVSWHIQNILESLKKKTPTSSQTEISDEEIEKASKFYKWKINQTFFEEGAKWYREQLKKKQ